MKITDERSSKHLCFDDLEPGDVFEFIGIEDQGQCLKISQCKYFNFKSNGQGSPNCRVNGGCWEFDGAAAVRKLTAEMLIKEAK